MASRRTSRKKIQAGSLRPQSPAVTEKAVDFADSNEAPQDEKKKRKVYVIYDPNKPKPIGGSTGVAASRKKQLKVLELGQNKSGEFFVREAVYRDGKSEIVTWHFDAHGEQRLRDARVQLGQRIPKKLFQDLKKKKHLVTGGKQPKRT